MINEIIYQETINQLKLKLDGEINPYVTVAAKAVGCDPDTLRADPNFWKLTTGKRKRRILVTQLAAYLLTKKGR